MKNTWPQVKLSELLTQVSRSETVDPEKTYDILGAHWYAEGLYTKNVLGGTEIQASKVYRVAEGDFVYNRLFGWKGSFALATAENDGCYVSNEFPCFDVLSNRLDGKFLWFYFSRHLVWDEALRLSSGGTPTSRNRLKQHQFLSMEIPLPPLDEQRQIVARIEKLSATIEQARNLRHKSREELEAFLASARNTTVAELRRHNDDVRLGEICSKITDGPHVSPRYTEDGIPFISVRNISESGLDFSTAKFVSHDDHAMYSQKAPVEYGDVLYTKGGTTGVARRVDTRRHFSIWVHVALLKLKRDMAESGFIEHMLNAPSSREQAERYTRGSSNRDLGLNRMCNIVFPLPPLPQQHRIVAYLDGLQAKVDHLKKLQEDTAKELDALLPSILSKAFAGEL